MNAVPFLCPMALNLHQKRPSSVTFGRLFHRTIGREIAAPSFVLMAMVQGNYPLGGYTFFNSPHPFPAFGNSVARRGSRLRVAFACIVGENSVKEKWTIDDFRHP